MKLSSLALALFLAVLIATQTEAQRQPSGVAIDVTNADVQAALKKTAAATVSDQQLRVVDIDGEYNVGVGVLHRAKTDPTKGGGGALTHTRITEVYHIISGNGTLVTGGTLVNARELPPDNQIVKVLAGPGATGSGIQSGVSRKVGPGDVIILPPATPHTFSEVTSDEIVYLVVRMDPHKVLPAGYGAK
ncbi:MAG TPA: hypothetical protein VEV17_02405 [Bryobacteraceae bacterium]|nr:hypothetical protein [Bryobacteraceae bacterium]